MSSFQLISQSQQSTLKKTFSLKGYSMVKNKEVNVECLPAKANQGIVFEFKNHYLRVKPTSLKKDSKFHTSNLSNDKIKIKTVEHILSAFYALGVDNVIIRIKGDNQLPLLDGSSYLYAQKIIKCGLSYLSAPKKIIKVVKPFVIQSENKNLAILLPNNQLVIQAIIDFNNILSVQEQEFVNSGNKYVAQISKARTFFIKHFDLKRWHVLQNKFRILEDDPTKSPIITYKPDQYVTNLRFTNEPVRHKILDFLGDLTFLGHQLVGKIIVYRPGHAFTQQIIKNILKNLEQNYVSKTNT